MQSFAYRAIDREGRQQQGMISAASQQDAMAQLRARQVHPISVMSAAHAAHPQKSQGANGQAPRAIKPRDVEAFMRQLARMVQAGLSVDRSLAVLSTGTAASGGAFLAADIRAQLRLGRSIHAAFASHSNVFDAGILALIAAGDGPGKLGTALSQAEKLIGSRNQTTNRIRSAMIYPAILAIVALASVLSILLFVIPKFRDLISMQDDALPFASRVVFVLSDLAISAGPWLMVGLLGIGALIIRSAMRGGIEQAFLSFFRFVPGLSNVVADSATSRLLRLLGTQLKSGVPLTHALQVSVDSLPAGPASSAMNAVRTDVRGGKALSSGMRQSALFPELALQMLEVGEETGDIGGMLVQASDILDEKTDQDIKRIFIVFEPMLLVTMGLIIGGLLYGLFSAILTLNQSVL
jgi:type II secretory pathway component PulF